MKKPIAIFGGTFDPVHNGHLQIAQLLMSECDFDHIRFIPCYLPVHRKEPGANPDQRLAMLALATQNQASFMIDSCEILRQGPSYMIDTLIELKKQFPENPLVLVLGFDAWAKFNHWHEWQQILETANLLIISRPGYYLPIDGELVDVLKEHQTNDFNDLAEHDHGKILVLDTFHISDSATQARELIQQDEPYEALLPASICTYIKKNRLYQQK